MADRESQLDRLEQKVDRLLEMIEEILTKGTGRKPGRITKELERHGEMLEAILEQVEGERENGGSD
jgi:hypothetical protein